MRNEQLRLKVLQVGPLPPAVGGMATVVDNLSKTLPQFCESRVLNNCKTTTLNRSVYQGMAAQLKLLLKLAKIDMSWSPDIVHIHTCSWFSFWRSCVDVWLSRLLGRTVVLHVHGGQFGSFLDSLTAWQIPLVKFTFRLCGSVVVLGDTWKSLLEKWCEPNRIKVVPNGVSVEPERHREQQNVFTIICLAGYTPDKGQRDLLEAVVGLKSDRPIRAVLLGGEQQQGEKQFLMNRAAELGISDRIEVPGPVVGEAKEAWWREASCFCLPSYHEGLPISMLEAMAKSVPIVVSRVGSVPEVINDGKEGLLFTPGDISALTSHLQTLSDNPAQAYAIGIEGRKRVLREFSLDLNTQNVLDIYRQLAKRQSQNNR